MSKEVLKLALAFIEAEGWGDSEVVITAIKEALAQPQQEPVAYWIPKAEQFCIADPSGRPFAKAWKPLYTSPPAQRKPLTLREIGAVCGNFSNETIKVVRQTEGAHGIKENK